MTPEQGYVGQQPSLPDLIGRTGTVTAVLRPSGKVLVDRTYYEAVAEDGLYIERGAVVEIVRAEGGLLYCPAGRRAGLTGWLPIEADRQKICFSWTMLLVA